MKQTIFQSWFSNLEDHIKCCGKYRTVIDQNAHFHMHHFVWDTLYVRLIFYIDSILWKKYPLTHLVTSEKKKKKKKKEKVYLRSQILECPSIDEYWNISGVPVLPENVIFMFFRTCRCYSEAFSTGMQKWSSIVQYSCTSIWDLKYTFSLVEKEIMWSLILYVVCMHVCMSVVCNKWHILQIANYWSLYPHTLMNSHGTWTQWSLGRVTHVTSTDMGSKVI